SPRHLAVDGPRRLRRRPPTEAGGSLEAAGGELVAPSHGLLDPGRDLCRVERVDEHGGVARNLGRRAGAAPDDRRAARPRREHRRPEPLEEGGVGNAQCAGVGARELVAPPPPEPAAAVAVGLAPAPAALADDAQLDARAARRLREPPEVLARLERPDGED